MKLPDPLCFTLAYLATLITGLTLIIISPSFLFYRLYLGDSLTGYDCLMGSLITLVGVWCLAVFIIWRQELHGQKNIS